MSVNIIMSIGTRYWVILVSFSASQILTLLSREHLRSQYQLPLNERTATARTNKAADANTATFAFV